MPNHLSPLRALSGFQGNHCASPKVFGAKGDGVADDLVPMQNTINHLKGLRGGGTLVVDGRYRVTGALQMDARVSLEGTGSGNLATPSSAILLDHATSSLFTWAAAGGGPGSCRQRLKNFFIGAMQPNVGSVLANTASSPLDLLVENLAWNENPSTGNMQSAFWQSSVASYLRFKDCWFNQVSGASVVTTTAGDDLSFEGCKFLTPSGADSHVVAQNSGYLSLTGCEFVGGSTPTNGASFVHVGSSGIAKAVNNLFRSLDGNAWPSFTWGSGAVLVESGSIFSGNGVKFNGSATAVLASGSRVSLNPDTRLSLAGNAILPDYVENITIVATSSTSPTYTMPHCLFPGQRLRISVQNFTGGSMTPAFSPSVGSITNDTITSFTNGSYASYTFVVSDIVTAGTYLWFMTAAGHTL